MKKIIIIITLAVAIAVLFANCNTQKCYPSKKSKDYARSATIRKVKEGWLVTERNGFTITKTIYECWPIGSAK